MKERTAIKETINTLAVTYVILDVLLFAINKML